MLDPKERFRKYSLRSVFDGILYIVKTGVQWRMLPSDFAPWQTVYYYFSKWKNEGLLEEIFDTLRGIVRRLSGRAESPSLGIIDSRSVRTSHHIDGQRGIDENKKIKGRKEHIVVDTLGLPMSVRVHPANVHDSVGGGRGVRIHEIQIPWAETDSGGRRLQGRDCQEHGHETAALRPGCRTQV